MEKKIHNLIALGALAFCGFLYFFRFKNYSEEAMMSAAYLWIPLLVFIIVGRLILSGKKGSEIRPGLATGFGLMAALGSYLLLLVFFEVVWAGM